MLDRSRAAPPLQLRRRGAARPLPLLLVVVVLVACGATCAMAQGECALDFFR